MRLFSAFPLRILAPALAAILLEPSPGACAARDFGPYGLAIKMGEGAGPFGAQVAYNLNPSWQVLAGVGGASIPYLLDIGHARTDSYFLMGKFFLHHAYFSAGYSFKRTRVERSVGDKVYSASGREQGIPFHLGYEFGRRKGFFFSTSFGFLYVPGFGDRELRAGTDSLHTTARTAKTGASIGLTVGYYFPGFR